MRNKKIAQFAAGTLISSLLSVLTLPITAWIFSPEDIGRLNVLQTLIPLVLNGVFLGLDQAYVREYHESSDKRLLYSTTMLPSTVLLFAFSLPVVIFPTEISRLLFGINSPVLALGVVVALFTSLWIRQRTLNARMHEKAISFSLAQVVPKVVHLVGLLLVLVLSLTREFSSLLTIVVVSQSIALIFIVLATVREQPIRGILAFDWARFVKVLRFGLPTMVSAFLYVALTASGTVMLRFLSVFSELGVYALAISVALVVGILQSIFSTVWSPIIFRAQAEGRAESAISRVIPLATLSIGIAISGLGSLSWALPLFLPADYQAISYLVIGAAITPLVYLAREIASIGISITRRTSLYIPTTMLALVVAVVLGFLLIPEFGAAGAIAANVASLWVLFVVTAELSARVWFAPRRKSLHLVIGMASLLSIFSLWLGHHGALWFSWLWLFFGIVLVIVGRRELCMILAKVWRLRKS